VIQSKGFIAGGGEMAIFLLLFAQSERNSISSLPA
jgi:hypothetical protein